MRSVLVRNRTTVAVLGVAVLGAVSLLPWWRSWSFDPFGSPADVQGWNVWETSRTASTAVVLSALGLLAGLRAARSGARSIRRLAPVAVAWTAVLLLAVQVNRLGPTGVGVLTLTDVQGVQGIATSTPEHLALADPGAPILTLLDEENLHRGIGYGGYLGAALLLGVAVLLTLLLRRLAEPRPGPAESAGPVEG